MIRLRALCKKVETMPLPGIKHWRSFPTLLIALGLISVGRVYGAPAGDSFEQGRFLFQNRQYTQAASSFTRAIANNSNNSNAYYYLGLSYQYARNFDAARATFRSVVSKFPGTQAAQYAASALQAMDGKPNQASVGRGSAQSGSTSVAADSRAGLDRMPDECYVRFDKEGELLIVKPTINGRQIEMVFDTGAEMIAFGKNHLSALGIAPPSGKPTGSSIGVGDGGEQPTWETLADVALGAIERRRLPITIQEYMPTKPLLGQIFFQDFKYTIDNGSNSIHFVRKNRGGGSIYENAGRDPNSVPFTREGNEIVVVVNVNGKPSKFYFDTGAEIVSLTHQQLRELGITIPEDAQHGTVTGIAGNTHSFFFPVQRLQMGPIDSRDVMVSVGDSDKEGKGLLGQNFFKEWQFSIDYTNNRIKFLRR